MQAHYQLLARYNLWATHKLYEHVDALPEADYRGDCGLFFRSVHGTLNHLLVGTDLLWYPRFALGVSPQGVALSDEAEPDRQRLKQRLIESGERWCALVNGFDPQRYQGLIDYTTTRGTRAVLPFAATLAHVFNHGTHHRGQITAAITARGHACPEIDPGTVHTNFHKMRCGRKRSCARRETQPGLAPGKALQRRAWPFWPQPEGNGVKTVPLVVALLAQTASLGVVARLDWRGFNPVRTCEN